MYSSSACDRKCAERRGAIEDARVGNGIREGEKLLIKVVYGWYSARDERERRGLRRTEEHQQPERQLQSAGDEMRVVAGYKYRQRRTRAI
jgi:hypothetical protein